MITKDQMMLELIQVCPSFQSSWETFLADWQKGDDDLPYYIALTEFAKHLIDKLERSDTQNFPAIFATVEPLCIDGDQYVQEAIVIGLLEDLQNFNLHNKTKPQQFYSFFRQESAKAWDELYEFWRKVKSQDESLQIDPASIHDPKLRQFLKELFRRE